jgi:hypothetical protein
LDEGSHITVTGIGGQETPVLARALIPLRILGRRFPVAAYVTESNSVSRPRAIVGQDFMVTDHSAFVAHPDGNIFIPSMRRDGREHLPTQGLPGAEYHQLRMTYGYTIGRAMSSRQRRP